MENIYVNVECKKKTTTKIEITIIISDVCSCIGYPTINKFIFIKNSEYNLVWRKKKIKKL